MTRAIHEYKVDVIACTAFHSGRPLYRVVCVTCDLIVHPGTTSAEYQQRAHERDAEAGYQLNLWGKP